MTAKTFTNAAGGSWETDGNWTPTGVPGASDDALINLAGTYTVAMSSVESPNSVTLSDAAATLSILVNAQLVGSTLTINAGTLAVTGLLEGATIVDNGGVFAPSAGTLDGVTWQGPLGGPGTTSASVNIKDGITLLNLAGTGPGTLDIASLYMVNILDSTPLSNMTINLDAYNNEYLTGSFTQAMVLDTTTLLNQSLPSAMGQVGGAKLINNGTISATGVGSSLFIQSSTFVNTGTLLAANGDKVTVSGILSNTGSIGVGATAKMNFSDAAANALSNAGTISVATGATLTVSGSLGGSGVITLANLAVVDMFNTSNTGTFLDAKGTIRLEAPGSFTGKIAGLQKGDKIDLLATAVTKLSYAGTTASGVLTVMNSGSTVAALSLLGDYTQSTFAFGSDGLTGNNITVAVTSAAARTLGWTGAGGTSAFNAPSNWNDISDALNPALTAPGTIDTVQFNTAGGAISGTSTVAVAQVGKSGAGVLELSGGAVLATGSLDIGVVAADVGQVGLTGAGSQLIVTNGATVADAGNGVLSVLPGATVAAASLIIGNAGNSSGDVDVSGAGSVLKISGALDVGKAGFGQLSISHAATVTAGSADAAASAGGDGAITVTGIGSALNVSGLLTVGDQSSGSLNIVNGASVTLGGLAIGTGVAGSGNVVIGSGSHLTLTGTSINVGLAGSGVLDIQGGTLGLVAGTTLSPGTFGRIVQVGGLIDPATVFDASGGSFGGGGTAEASGTIVNSGQASVTGGAETLLAPLITSNDPANTAGTWSIKSGGLLVLDVNTFDNSQTIQFGDATGVLTIGQQVTLDATQTPVTIAASALNGFAAPIVGYKAGDKITFAGVTVASDQVSGNVVTLFNSGNKNLGSLTFQTGKGGPDGNGAALAAAQIACFAAGTGIATPSGPRAVEGLAVGDPIVLADGGSEPIVWIGQRAVNCRAHPKPETVWPVRVSAGAFGANVPVRELYLSPDHAIYVNEVLVPVKLLINGTSITQLKRDHVTYFHVELPEHAVILAEGLTVESYLDTGDRANFNADIGTIRLHPDFAARLAPNTALMWEARAAARLVTTGTELDAARRAVTTGRSHRESRAKRAASKAPGKSRSRRGGVSPA